MLPIALSACLLLTQGVRPTSDYEISSTKHPVVIHATFATSHAYAEQVRSYVDTSWDTIVDKMGFRMPRPDGTEGGDDRLDVYIRGDLQPGIGGYTGFSGFYDPTPEMDAVGYLVIADNLAERYMRGVVAHEFFHLSQMSYDWFEHPGFMEATAVWVTDHVFDDENFYQNYYAYFNQSPHQSLDFISLADPYQYGAGLWFQFLDEHYGTGNGAFIRRLWEETIQMDMSNEPDYFDATRTILGGKVELQNAFRLFGQRRLNIGSRALGRTHVREAETWPDRLIPTMTDLGTWSGDTPLRWSLPFGMQPYSHSYLRVKLAKGGELFRVVLDEDLRRNVTIEVVFASESERIIVLTRTAGDDYDPETADHAAISVSGYVERL